MADSEARLQSFHADRSWLAAVSHYTGFSEAELAPAGAADDAGEADLPAAGISPALHAAREIVRYERMARADIKWALHREWLKALAASVRPGRPFELLDYGCGASSFAALALDLPEVRATLADANAAVLSYLQWRAERRGETRVRTLPLPARQSAYGSYARMRVDVTAVRERYDAIVLADVLEHTLDPLRVLTHLLARLRPGGLIFVSYPSEIDGDWHTPEAFHQRAACFRLLRYGTRPLVGHARRRRAAPFWSTALVLARAAEPGLRRRARRFARRIFEQQGAAIVARVRDGAQRELSVGDLLADV